MSSTQQLATKTASNLRIGDVVPPAPALPATVEPPKQPKVPITERVKQRIDAFQKSPLGEGVSNWVNTVGSVAGYVVPVAVAAGVGYAVGGMTGSARVAESVMWTWGVAGAVASIGSQGSEALANVKLYKAEGHPFPRLAAFRDVMGWFVIPAAAAGYAAALFYGPDIATYTAAGVGAAFGTMGLSVQAARSRRVSERRSY